MVAVVVVAVEGVVVVVVVMVVVVVVEVVVVDPGWRHCGCCHPAVVMTVSLSKLRDFLWLC